MKELNCLNALDPVETLSNFIFLGEAGSGKSEIAINLTRLLAKQGDKKVHFFDLDMTKPLFRSRDQGDKVEKMGAKFHYEEQFMDAPTLTGGVSRLLRDENCYTVLDVGGDYIGARSIGGYAELLNQSNTAVCYVMNPFRPWSTSLERIDKVLGETLGVSHIQLERVRLLANPNLGTNTSVQDVVEGYRYLRETVSPYKPFDCICVQEKLYDGVKDAISIPLFPIRLYLTYPWDDSFGCL